MPLSQYIEKFPCFSLHVTRWHHWLAKTASSSISPSGRLVHRFTQRLFGTDSFRSLCDFTFPMLLSGHQELTSSVTSSGTSQYHGYSSLLRFYRHINTSAPCSLLSSDFCIIPSASRVTMKSCSHIKHHVQAFWRRIYKVHIEREIRSTTPDRCGAGSLPPPPLSSDANLLLLNCCP